MSDTRLWTHHQDENRISLEEGYYRQDYIKSYVSRYIPTGGTILEIGFGDGYLLANLAPYYTMYGQDLSEENIEITKKDWPEAKVTYLLGDESGKLLVDDSSLDGFIASEVCEHMTDEELVVFVKELKRTLKPDGHAIITVPFHENLAKSTHFCPHCGNTFHTWGHKQSWTDEKLQKVFHGFQDIKIKRFISLGKSHHKNIFIRGLAKILDCIFLWKKDFLEGLPSNYLVILKK